MAGTKSPATAGAKTSGPKPHARLEKWIWVLIYGGLFLVILGIATGRSEPGLGWSIALPGAAAFVVGVVLIYVRSRLGDGRTATEP